MKKILLAIAATIAISTTAQAEWKSSKDVDEMTGVKKEFFTTESTDRKGDIYIRTKTENGKSSTQMYWINGDRHICSVGDPLKVMVKIDNGEVFEETVSLSTDKSAMFFTVTKSVLDKKGTYVYEEWKRLLQSDLYKGMELAKEYEKSTTRDTYKDVSNGLVEKLKGAKQIFLRVHDHCGTQTTQKFVF